MAINKVIFNDEAIIDLTGLTVDTNNLLQGVTAHNRGGNAIIGNYVSIKPQIIVITDIGNYLTCSKNGEPTLYGIAADGVYAFEVPSYGTWTITAYSPYTSNSQSASVNVTSIKQYTISITTVKVFADTGWDDIATYAHNGTAQEIWDVGDTKTVTLSNGDTVTLEIVDFYNGDSIILGLKDIITSQSASNSSYQNPASLWATGTFKPSLPQELQSVITSFSWAFAVDEVSGSNAFALFTTNGGRMKSSSWWLSTTNGSPSGAPSYVYNQYYVSTTGDVYTNYSTNSCGVNPKIVI